MVIIVMAVVPEMDDMAMARFDLERDKSTDEL